MNEIAAALTPMRDDLIAARKRIEELEKALLPLAKQADFYKPELMDAVSVSVPLAFLRYARRQFGGELPEIEEILGIG